MIADLRGRTMLRVAVEPVLADALDHAFGQQGAECHAVQHGELDAALEDLRGRGRSLDAFVIGSGPLAPAIGGLDDYSAEALARAITRGAWSSFDGLLRVRRTLGRLPRHTVVLSKLAPDRFVAGADFSAASEAVLETLCRYFSEHMSGGGTPMNVLRYRLAFESAAATEGVFAVPEEVAGAALALCSGLLDSMHGQVLTVDRGGGFGDNVFRRYEQNAGLGNR